MKNLIILALIASPLSAFAYDALTPTEMAQAIADNANFLLKSDYQIYCEVEPLRIEKEIAAINMQSIPEWSKSSKTQPLYRQLQELILKCEETKQKIKDQSFPTADKNLSIGCGPSYIKRGGVCITPTAVCQMYFGQNVSGVKSASDKDVAECTCNTGFTMTGGVCIASNTSNTASAVLGVSTVNSDAQLKAIIAQLTAQVSALIQQLNTRMGR